MACFFKNYFKRQKKRPSFLVFQRQNILFVFSIFFLHFASASPLAGVNPHMVPQVIGALTKVMGQAEDNCGPEVGELDDSDSCNNEWKDLVIADEVNCSAEDAIECDAFITNIGDILEQAAQAVEYTGKKGIETCRCCLMPSVCLLGGVGRIVDLLRVGNYAGLLLGLNNNKICSAIQKTQQASMALDGISGTKCIMKGRNCKQTHRTCIENLDALIVKIEKRKENCQMLNCRREIADLNEHIENLERSSNSKCRTASEAGQSQMMQAAMTGVASLVAGECKKDYEEDTRCDDKKDEELDECCEKHPRADACKQDKCEGKQGAELDSCCTANPQSALCRGRINACHPIQLTNDPDKCMEKCRQDPTLPGCKNFCNLNWHREICAEVCKTYEMPRCDDDSERRNVCEESGDHVCCTNTNGPECSQFCSENPESQYCQCRSNPGRCRCDREEDIPYMPEGQCSTTNIASEDCEDSNDPACFIPGNDNPNVTSGEDDGGDPEGGPGSPFPEAAPFPDANNGNPNKPNPSGATKYSPGAGSGGGGGGLGGGGLGGGSGGGSGEEGGEQGEEGGDPYENILAGLSGSQNKGQGYGSSGGRRGGRARSGSGFDLKKFLPKKKKGKKAGKKKANRVPSSVDNIFDLSSQMMNRYCENNNINCVQK